VPWTETEQGKAERAAEIDAEAKGAFPGDRAEQVCEAERQARLQQANGDDHGEASPDSSARHGPNGDARDRDSNQNYGPGQDSRGDGRAEPRAEPQPDKPKRQLKIIDAALLCATAPLERRFVDGFQFFMVGKLGYLSGAGAVGKSLLALQLACAVALEAARCGFTPTWLDRPVGMSGRVLFVSSEDDADEINRRLQDIAFSAMGRPFDTDLLKGRLWIVDLVDEINKALLQQSGRIDIAETETFRLLREIIADFKPDLVFLDNRAQLADVEENIRNVATKVGNHLAMLCLQYGLTVIPLVHPSQAGLNSGSGTSGSTGWGNTGRGHVDMTNEQDDGGLDKGARVLTNKKANYSQMGVKVKVQWRLGVYVNDAPKADDGIGGASKAELVFMRMLETARDRGVQLSANPAATKTYAPAYFFQRGDREGLTKPQLERAMFALLDRKVIKVVAVGTSSRQKQILVIAETEYENAT
jgi:hypothetical protein